MMNHGFQKWILLALISLPSALATAQTPPVPPEQPAATNSAAPSTITLPAGTRMLVMLRSPLHTTSAENGSGVYSETASAVVQDNRVVIPLKAQVQGIVESEQWPGRIKGRARFLLHFNTLIFSNNYAVPMDAALLLIRSTKTLPALRRPASRVQPWVRSAASVQELSSAQEQVRSLAWEQFSSPVAMRLSFRQGQPWRSSCSSLSRWIRGGCLKKNLCKKLLAKRSPNSRELGPSSQGRQQHDSGSEDSCCCRISTQEVRREKNIGW